MNFSTNAAVSREDVVLFDSTSALTTGVHGGKLTPESVLVAAIEKASALSLAMAHEVEAVEPRGNMGLWRHNHQQEARGTLRDLARQLNLSDHDTLLLELIGCSHDIGRYREFHIKQRDKVSTINHSVYSAMCLHEAGVLDDLSERDRQIALSAIRWHGERAVPETLTGPGRYFCYILRDADKGEIQEQVLIYSPEFALKEIRALFGLSPEEKTALLTDPAYLTIVANSLKVGGSLSELPAERRDDPLAKRVAAIMNSPLLPTHEAFLAAIESRSANASQCYDIYAGFFLMHLDMIFDIAFPETYLAIRNSRVNNYRLNFIAERCEDEVTLRRIINSLDSHITKGIRGDFLGRAGSLHE